MSINLFSSIPLGQPDAILGLNQAFRASMHPRKVNVGVGAYRDMYGKPVVLSSVQEAIRRLSSDLSLDHEYAPIEGLASFIRAAQYLMFGSESKAIQYNRLASVQGLSGTGSLRVGAEFLSRFTSTKQVYVSAPTWGNHIPIFKAAGFKVATYSYYSPELRGIDIDMMCRDLSAAEKGSIILLHSCAHNPTGIDPTIEQWLRIRSILRDRELFPFLDCAYQGFATGDVDRDARVVRLFDDDGRYPFAVAQSFAKNFGLYGERVGLLSIVCGDSNEAESVLSQLKIVVRSNYSSPPLFGARVVSTILNDEALTAQWKVDVKQLADRLYEMRTQLHDRLVQFHSPHPWDHLLKQTGMFAYTGILPQEVDILRDQYGIYMTQDGRISLAGLNPSNIEYVSEAIHKVTLKRM